MNKLDKEIIKKVIKYETCHLTLEGFVSQIKQSILKAIMEKMPKLKRFSNRQPESRSLEELVHLSIESHKSGFNTALIEFESVIKELLGENK